MDVCSRAVQLCVAGTAAEREHRLDDARRLYREAWEAATDDYQSAVAAHYIAHLEPDPSEALRWNIEALRRAELVGDGRADEFFGSLYVNLGRSYELVGDEGRARRYYALAAERGVVHRATRDGEGST